MHDSFFANTSFPCGGALLSPQLARRTQPRDGNLLRTDSCVVVGGREKQTSRFVTATYIDTRLFLMMYFPVPVPPSMHPVRVLS